MNATLPVFWSFRRCPYAMRARLALLSSNVAVELREILLKDKPDAFVATSASGTVPALRHEAGVLDESLDIMIWALKQEDPENLLDMPQEGYDLISENDGPFKTALDHTKYAVRFPDRDAAEDRAKGARFLLHLNERLSNHAWLMGPQQTLADLAILPFVRQFANTDRVWFDGQDWPHLNRWLTEHLEGPAFAAIMQKHKPWVPDQAPVLFPEGASP